MKKEFFVFVMAAVMAVSLCACGNSEDEETTVEETTVAETAVDSEDSAEEVTNTSDFEAVDLSAAGWNITLDNVQIASELSNTSEVLGYSSTSTSTFEQTANEGNTYVLFKMTIEKDGATENIVWDNMILTDADGNTYNRIDDSFIDSLEWERMAGTDLNFGTNGGWFAYEIPEDEAGSGLVLSYSFEDEIMEYQVH